MNQEQVQNEEEIDIREIIKTLIKRKKTVITVFLVVLIVSLVSILMTPKAYKAEALIMIYSSQIKKALSAETPFNDILSDTAKSSNTALEPHIRLLKSSAMLDILLENLQKERLIELETTKEELSNMLEIGKRSEKEAEKSNILTLVVTDKDPEKAAKIANLWAEEYIKYSSEFILKEAKGQGTFLYDQFDKVEKQLQKAEKEMDDFNISNDLELFEDEMNFKKEQIKEFKKELINKQYELEKNEFTLKVLEEEMKKHEKIITTSKAITDDALWNLEVQKNTQLNKEKYLEQENINPIYADLEKRIVAINIDVNTLIPEIEQIKANLKIIEQQYLQEKKEFIEKNYKKTKLTRQLNMEQNLYSLLSDHIKDERILRTQQLGDTRLLSSAIVSNTPIGTGKTKKLLLMSMVALMLGCFVAFFQEFWEKEKS